MMLILGADKHIPCDPLGLVHALLRVLLQVQQLFRQPDQNAKTMVSQSTLRNIFQTEVSLLYKIQVVQGKTAHECHEALHQACEDDVLPYCSMAYWVQAFKNSRDNMKDKSCTVCPLSAAGTAGM
jgi:hypothetical protein